jgi:hypothetical protein
MDEQMKSTLAEYLKKLLSMVEAGANFAVDQIPLVVQEKLAFDFWWAFVWFMVGLICGVSATLLIRTGIAVYRAREHRHDERFMGWVAPGTTLALLGTPLAMTNLYTILKISLAPRLYIIEWLVGTVK